MTDRIKIRVKKNNDEIEVEGSRKDVNELLDNWYHSFESGNDIPSKSGDALKKKTAKKGKRRAKNNLKIASVDNSAVSVVQLANKIKNVDNYKKYETTILHKSNAWNKVRFVLGMTDDELTSGDIHRTLKELGIRISTSNVSTTLKSHTSDVFTDKVRSKGAILKYTLTGKAKKDFNEFLKEKEAA